jgi:hypothetical protein
MVGQPDIKYIILVDQGMCVFVFILIDGIRVAQSLVLIIMVLLSSDIFVFLSRNGSLIKILTYLTHFFAVTYCSVQCRNI